MVLLAFGGLGVGSGWKIAEGGGGGGGGHGILVGTCMC